MKHPKCIWQTAVAVLTVVVLASPASASIKYENVTVEIPGGLSYSDTHSPGAGWSATRGQWATFSYAVFDTGENVPPRFWPTGTDGKGVVLSEDAATSLVAAKEAGDGKRWDATVTTKEGLQYIDIVPASPPAEDPPPPE